MSFSASSPGVRVRVRGRVGLGLANPFSDSIFSTLCTTITAFALLVFRARSTWSGSGLGIGIGIGLELSWVRVRVLQHVMHDVGARGSLHDGLERLVGVRRRLRLRVRIRPVLHDGY